MNGRSVLKKIDDLPDGLLHKIFSFLPLADRATVDEISDRWKRVNDRVDARCVEINSCLGHWGENARTPGQPNLLRIDLIHNMVQRHWQHLTEVDFWHPNATEIPPPPGSYFRAELLNVPHQGLTALTEHCHNLLDLSLCSCVVPFNEGDLRRMFANSRQIRFLSIRADLNSYDFFQALTWKPVTVVRLDLPSMDFEALVGNLVRFKYMRVLTINYPGKEVNKDFIPEAWESCRYSINAEIDVRSACR